MRIKSGTQSIQRVQASDRRTVDVDYRARRLQELESRIADILARYPFDRVRQYEAMQAIAAREGIGMQTLVDIRANQCEALKPWVKPITHYNRK